ncbi:MAG: CbrC family protein [Clostridiales bacterium]|jgi:uncharacterized protein CbrC (UPF0167 family)|nr:CbrC family protein [Clostridiales bacterium]
MGLFDKLFKKKNTQKAVSVAQPQIFKPKKTVEELWCEVSKQQNPCLLKDIPYPSNYPQFKFNLNPLRTQAVIESSIPCECCGKIDKYSYIAGIDHYAKKEVPEIKNLCLYCIYNGEAIKKFGGAFTDKSFIANKTASKEVTEEIMYRTPSFTTWQEKEWLSHCKMPCTYIGQVYIGDLLKMGIYKQVRTELSKTFYYRQMPMTISDIDDMLIDMVEDSSIEGHLFMCIICKKYKLSVDLD